MSLLGGGGGSADLARLQLPWNVLHAVCVCEGERESPTNPRHTEPDTL